jgi:DNA-binding LytR/AlgR family response regulator
MSDTESPKPLRALIADDERLMREQLQTRLQQVWPELDICGTARDGNEAVDMADALRPDVVFLDIRMPGLTGVEAAREIVALDGWRGHIVFVTAYDEYAVTAFEQGALDYLLKPVEADRLALTVQRIKGRLAQQPQAPVSEAAVDGLLDKLLALQRGMHATAKAAPETMRWIQCSFGSTLKLVAVEEVLFFRSDEKYTRVQTRTQEALIRTPIRELVPQLDPHQFWQIHRSTIVNLGAIASVQRDESGRQRVHLKEHPEVLEVSRSFGHLFRQA